MGHHCQHNPCTESDIQQLCMYIYILYTGVCVCTIDGKIREGLKDSNTHSKPLIIPATLPQLLRVEATQDRSDKRIKIPLGIT